MTDRSVIVVGGGIVGLAVAHELTRTGRHVRVLEKEPALAAHQTGRNSGVIHSGLYYKPRSLKATLCVAGAESMKQFALEHGIAHDVPGKLVVAADDRQVTALRELQGRGDANGVPSTWLSAEQAHEVEPHVRCIVALHVHSTGRIDYARSPAPLRLSSPPPVGRSVSGSESPPSPSRRPTWSCAPRTTSSRGDLLVNCAGLHSDRIARLGGLTPDVRIIPFRGVSTLSRRPFPAALRALVPDLPVAAPATGSPGVRAQAIDRTGALVDDFHFARSPRQVHVLNAPSPAATASLEIARHIVTTLHPTI